MKTTTIFGGSHFNGSYGTDMMEIPDLEMRKMYAGLYSG
jgi:hypothetical protein